MLAEVKNWDEDRLAPLDTVLIMMAIAEFYTVLMSPSRLLSMNTSIFQRTTAVLRVRTLSMA